MADTQKRLEKAEKYLQKGKPADALEEYLGILEDDPTNEKAKQQAADLNITLGQNADACHFLSELFDKQAEIGDSAKAVANYKKLARLGTPNVDQTFKFSTFIERTDKKAALEGYEFAINSYQAGDRQKDALGALKRVVSLDPSAANLKRMGELGTSLGDAKGAADAYLKLADWEPDHSEQWLAKGYELKSGITNIDLAYGRVLLDAGKSEKSVEVLAPIATGANSAPEFREVYARALMAAGRPEDAEPLVWESVQKDPKQAGEIG